MAAQGQQYVAVEGGQGTCDVFVGVVDLMAETGQSDECFFIHYLNMLRHTSFWSLSRGIHEDDRKHGIPQQEHSFPWTSWLLIRADYRASVGRL